MRILPIQANYVNKINFKQNESNTVSSPMEDTQNNKFANKNTQKAVTVGLGALAVIGLVYAGYRGKLGAKIQKLLGGASDATKSVERNTPEVNGSVTKPSVKPDNADINPNSTTELADDIKIIGGEEPKKVFDGSDAEDVEFVEDIHKFLTPEEFKSLPREEMLKRVGADLDEISKSSNSFDEYDDAAENYFEKYGIVDTKDEEYVKEHADILNVFIDVAESKFTDELAARGVLNELKLSKASIKLILGEHDDAEKIVMNVLNNVELNQDKIGSYAVLNKIADKSEKPEKYFQIINKELEKDSKAANELQIAAREYAEKFGVRESDFISENSDIYKFLSKKHYFKFLDSLLDNLAVKSEDVPMRDSIKSIIESNAEVEKFILGRKAAN